MLPNENDTDTDIISSEMTTPEVTENEIKETEPDVVVTPEVSETAPSEVEPIEPSEPVEVVYPEVNNANPLEGYEEIKEEI